VNAQQVGVGLLFNPTLDDFVLNHAAQLDHLAVIPDRTWLDQGQATSPRFTDLFRPLEILNQVAKSVPLVMHAIGMSICSAEVFDQSYVKQLAQWRTRFNCAWVSDHLSFSRVGTGHERNAAMALPSPYDSELLELLIPRVLEVQSQLGCRFLLENNVYYFSYPEQELSEVEFLNQLTQRTGCGLLLDLHNLHTNAVNHGFDPIAFLDELALENVVEIHLAGGIEMMGFHTDSHSGPVLEEVWALLRCVAARSSHMPALRSVTFEFHDSSWSMLGVQGVCDQLAQARDILASANMAH
jgi:uncharacterized protein